MVNISKDAKKKAEKYVSDHSLRDCETMVNFCVHHLRTEDPSRPTSTDKETKAEDRGDEFINKEKG